MAARGVLDRLVELAALDAGRIPPHARQIARLSLFDWLTVARAGSAEPAAAIVRAFVTSEGGREEAQVAGQVLRVPARAAALANATISHALDYDDTHFAHIGHPSVAVLPAALAVAERQNASASALADAFLLGAEASVRIGMTLGRSHYDRGFHQTATAGAFGATMAAGRLLGLDPQQMRHALNLVTTRASGLKSQFGSMGKPFNAGMAAANGVEAAMLAGLGLVSCDDGFGGAQGFIATHAGAGDVDEAWASPPSEGFRFEDVKYKLHACCHGTHAMIEALRATGVAAADLARIEVRTNPRWLSVCDIKAPRTGLEIKFSYAALAAMVLADHDTAALATYSDRLYTDERLLSLQARVHVTGDPSISDTAAAVAVTLADGTRIAREHDLAAPLPAAEIEQGLRRKSRSLLGAEQSQRIWRTVEELDRRSARDIAGLLG